MKFLETLLVADLAEIKNGSGSLSVFTNDQGGIVDDTVLTKVIEPFMRALHGQRLACSARCKVCMLARTI